jgi:hypothetical protein
MLEGGSAGKAKEEVKKAPPPRWSDLMSVLISVKNNVRLDTVHLSSRRKILVANAISDVSEALAGENFFRLYNIDQTVLDPRDREYFSSDKALLQYLVLQATTRCDCMRDSLRALIESSSPAEFLPFSFSPSKNRMSRADFACCVSLTMGFVSILYPAVWDQKNWGFPAVNREAIELNMRASMYDLAQREEESLMHLFGKTHAQFPTPDKWTFAKTLRFVNPIFSKVLGMEFKKSNQIHKNATYTFDSPSMFIWREDKYVPRFGTFPPT